MNKLLSTLLISIISVSSSSLVVNSTKDFGSNEIFAKEDYWNPVHKIEIRNARSKGRGPGGQDPKMSRAVYTFNLGSFTDQPTFTQFNFLEPAQAYIDWGNDRMGTWNLEPFTINFDQEHNYRVRDINDTYFFTYLKYKLFDQTFRAFLATCNVRLYLGYTWYFFENEYYFQFLLFQYINVKSTFSSGLNEINLGSKISFS